MAVRAEVGAFGGNPWRTKKIHGVVPDGWRHGKRAAKGNMHLAPQHAAGSGVTAGYGIYFYRSPDLGNPVHGVKHEPDERMGYRNRGTQDDDHVDVYPDNGQ